MSKILLVHGGGLPPGVYDAVVESAKADAGVLCIDFKVDRKVDKNELILIEYMAQLNIPEFPEFELNSKDSWQRMNKGKVSKKQRRKL